MHLGIFAKTFPHPTLGATLDAVVAHGLRAIQFNFACVGLPPMPDTVAPALLEQIRGECESRRIDITGVSGTFNMAHPDARPRAEGLRRLATLAPATRALGCNFISLCTGTRDPQDMWRAHLENDSPAALYDLRTTMEQALAIANEHDVLLGIEPETGNVIRSALKARQLLDDMKSPRLKIILDPANLFHSGHTERMRETITEAVRLLGPDIHMAHAKELAADGSMGNLAPGRGVIDWAFYFQCLHEVSFSGPVVMHGLAESDVASAVTFLKRFVF